MVRRTSSNSDHHRLKSKEVKQSEAQQLRELAELMLPLIEGSDRLPPSPERGALLDEIFQYRDRLSAITARKAEH